MVRREAVTDVQGQRWVSGEIDADTYFREARERARATARQTVAQRLAQPVRVRPAR
ncbi:hypothetical protein EV189_3151 [Motilibacter rhizosphaerae]|uniref:Uncharacterized protein n=1 Tax=Motilibacter rhizosphaerae TaxID=598652 RepID=A0A4Q7NH31_9ACTN|nr:hypothetical protein [Motilibacter rhizosphaerae]RZS82756.1 hypothetical protein EV189_3151 [Motilibacter rhizosphaerae]